MTTRRVRPESDFFPHAFPAVEDPPPLESDSPPEEEGGDSYVEGRASLPEGTPSLLSPLLAVDLYRNPDNSLICNSCWRENEVADSDHHFCIHCGNSLRLGHAAASLPVAKREDVAILFVKVSGYEHSDPEMAAGYLEHLRQIVGETVRVMGGFVKFMGDKAMIAFGALGEVEGNNKIRSNAMRALHAWQMIVSELDREETAPLTLWGGAHLGEVVAGTLGVTGEKKYDFLGRDVNFAARLLGVAEPKKGLVMSLPFYTVLRKYDFDAVDFEDEVPLKGFEGTHEIYRLDPSSQAEIPYPLPADRTETFDLSACGRHDELESSYCPYCGNPSEFAENKEQTVAQYRNVFVLSIDMVGFSTLGRSLTPAEVFEWVDDFYRVAEPILTRHHGIIIERNGDELVSRFGVPSVGKNAINAVLAGIDLREALVHWNRRHEGFPIRVRMGIHSEKALIKETTTLGPIVEKAQQRQSLAPISGLLIDEETARLVQGCFVMQKTEAGYEIVEPIPQAIELARRRSQEIPIIGRDRQRDLIDGAFREVKKGHLQTRLLRGSSGSGRESVLDHFYLDHSSELTVLSARVTDWQADPLRSVFRKMADDEEKLDQWIRRMNFRFLKGREIPYGFADVSDFIKSVLGRYVGLETNESEGMKFLRQNPAQLRAWTVRGIGWILEALAQKKPIVLDLRDLDKADPDSLAFLEEVTKQVKNCPVAVFATATQGLAFGHQEEILFENLDRENTKNLVLAVLIGEHLPSYRMEEEGVALELGKNISDDVVDLLYPQSGGHPLYLAELARASYQRGIVFWNEQSLRWELKSPATDERRQIPATLNEALLSRLDGLSRDEKNIFQAVSCLADEEGIFWLEPLEHLMQSGSEIHPLLARLEQRGMIAYQAVSTDRHRTEYRITPLLMAKAQYEIIPAGVRKKIHTIAYEWFSNQALSETSPSPAFMGTVAHHAFASGRYRQAFEFYSRAMSMAAGSKADQKIEALRYSERAEESLRRSPLPDASRHLFDLLNQRAEIYSKRGAKEGWEETLVRMEELLESNPSLDETRQLSALLARGDYKAKFGNDPQWHDGHYQNWEGRLDQVSPELAARFYFNRGRSHSFANHYEQALEAYTKAAGYAARGLDRKIEAKILLGLSSALLRHGEYQSSLDYAESAFPLLEETGDYHHACYCLINMYEDLFQLKRFEEAGEKIARANDLARRLGDQEALGYSCLNWGILLAYQQTDRSLSLQKIEEAVRVSRDSGLTHMLAVSLYTRGFLSVMDHPEQTLRDAREALDCPRISLAVRASALFVLAVGQWRSGQTTDAQSSLIEALTIRRELKGPINDFDSELLQFALFLVPDLEIASNIDRDILPSPSPLLWPPNSAGHLAYNLDEDEGEKNPEKNKPGEHASSGAGRRGSSSIRRARGRSPLVKIVKK